MGMTTFQLVTAVLLTVVGALLVVNLVMQIAIALAIINAGKAMRERVMELAGPWRQLLRRGRETAGTVRNEVGEMKADLAQVRTDLARRAAATRRLYREQLVLPVVTAVRTWRRRLQARRRAVRPPVVFRPAESAAQPVLYVVSPRRTRAPETLRRAA